LLPSDGHFSPSWDYTSATKRNPPSGTRRAGPCFLRPIASPHKCRGCNHRRLECASRSLSSLALRDGRAASGLARNRSIAAAFLVHGRPPALKPVTDPESWNRFEQSHLKTDEPNRALNGRSTRESSSRTRKRSARHEQQRHLELIPVQLRKWCQRERGNLERAAPVLGIDQSGGINLPTRAAGTTQNAGVELCLPGMGWTRRSRYWRLRSSASIRRCTPSPHLGILAGCYCTPGDIPFCATVSLNRQPRLTLQP
jgi:hypothetical protein